MIDLANDLPQPKQAPKSSTRALFTGAMLSAESSARARNQTLSMSFCYFHEHPTCLPTLLPQTR